METQPLFLSELTNRDPLNFFAYLSTLDPYDYLFAIIVGIVVALAREIYWHYEGSEKTTPLKALLQIPEGITFGIFGNEVANLWFDKEWNFILIATFAWGGAQVLDKIVCAIVALIDKVLPRAEEKAEKDFREKEKDVQRHREYKRKVEEEQFEQFMDKLQASPQVDNI